MYLRPEEGIDLLRRVVGHFPAGELQFDAFNSLGIRSQWSNAVVRRSGSRLHSAINGPDDIVGAVPGVRLLSWLSPFDAPSFRQVVRACRLVANLMSVLSSTRYLAQYHRYAFGGT